MASYSRYGDQDVEKAIKAVESGRTVDFAARRHGVPKTTLQRKLRKSARSES